LKCKLDVDVPIGGGPKISGSTIDKLR